jgi:hypothetical protein
VVVITVREAGVGATTVDLVAAVNDDCRRDGAECHHTADERGDRAPARIGRPGKRFVAVFVVAVFVVAVFVGSVYFVALVVGVVVDQAINWADAIVKCVSDGADVTDVNIEDRVSCDMLAQLGANRYLRPGPVSLTANL